MQSLDTYTEASMASQQIVKHRNAAIAKIIEETPDAARNNSLFAKIGTDFNLTPNYVRTIAVKAGLVDTKSHKQTRKQWEKLVSAVEAFPAGQRRAEIAKIAGAAGVSAQSLTIKCREAGVELLSVGGESIDTAFAILARHRQLGNMTAVAGELGVSKQFVSQVIAKARKAGAL